MPLNSLKALPFLLCLSLSGRLAADESATDTPADALQDVSDLVSDMDNYEAPPPAGAQTSGKEMWVRAHALHIRAEPRYESPVTGYLRHGAKVTIESTGTWSKIGPRGWVKTSWLQETPADIHSDAGVLPIE